MYKIDGIVIEQIGNVARVEMADDYVFAYLEQCEINPLKKTFREELQGLYWCLHNHIIKNNLQFKLPEGERWFTRGEHPKLALEKLYCLTRWNCNWVETIYRRDGMQMVVPRSTSREKCSQRQLTELYTETRRYLGTYIDLKNFEIEHAEARARLGKDY
jgi:hypothetical protein